jgi:ABC-type multidrug transport system permease subunit
MGLIKLIQKNFKLLFRSKLALLVVVLGPVIVMALSGVAFNNSQSYDIRVGVYSSAYSAVSDSFVSNLESQFKVTKYSTESSCIDAVKSKGYHSCIVIPPNLDITSGSKQTLMLHIDNSRVNIASSIKETIFASLENTSSGISTNLTTTLVGTVVLTQDEASKNKNTLVGSEGKVATINAKSSESNSLLTSANLDFNKEALNLTGISEKSSTVNAAFTNATKLVSDAINEYENTVQDIRNLNLSSSQLSSLLSSADSDISSLESRLNNVTLNSSVSGLVSLISSLTGTLTTLDQNLADARTKRQTATSNLGSIQQEVSSLSQDVAALKVSMDTLLLSIQSNPVLNAESIVQPVIVEERQIVVGSRLHYLFPGLVILMIMFVSMMTAASQVSFERHNRAQKRMAMTPTSFGTILLSIFITVMILILLQVILILVLMNYAFGISVLPTIFDTVPVLLFTTIFFILLGMTIGYLFSTENGTILSTLSVASVFLVLSDIILPLESMPGIISSAIHYTPFVLATDLLRQTLFFTIPIFELGVKYYVLLAYSFALLILIFVVKVISGFVRRLYVHRKSFKHKQHSSEKVGEVLIK